MTAVLDRWGGKPVEVDHDDRLGLALLTLRDLDGAAQRISERWPRVARGGVSKRQAVLDGPPDPIDVISRGLRHFFAKKWNGWQPTIGKNRVLCDVRGSYVIGIGEIRANYVIGIGGVESNYVIGIGSEPQSVDGAAAGFAPRAVRGDAATGQRPAPARGSGVEIAIVDTGIFRHPWLAGSYRCDPGAIVDDVTAGHDPAEHHGTFVAGLALRQAPGADLIVDQALDPTGHRDSWELAKDLARLGEAQVDIVNLSLGCFTEDDLPPLVLQQAAAQLGPRTLVVAAAGNFEPSSHRPRPSWPAALESVAAIGSFGPEGQDSVFSPAAPWIDARAQGEHVVSTYGGDTRRFPAFVAWDGTSFAAATASGYVAAQMAPGETAVQTWRRLAANPATSGPVRFGN
ncbi:MAG: S8 family peptidase [Propionibacteriaceae bacterium]